MGALLHDLRYGGRMIARNPGVSILATLTLSLGIGATTAIFSFVHAVLLRPLVFMDSESLVVLRTDHFAASPGDFLDWQEQNHVFAGMAAFTGATFSLTGSGEPERVMAATVTGRFFEVLGATPAIGRTLVSPDGQTIAADSVVISAGLWRRRYESSPEIVGRPITLDGKPYEIAGVMPAGFTFPRDLMSSWGKRMAKDIDIWMPLRLDPNERANAFLQVVARLKPDVAAEQAQAEMTTLVRKPDPEAGRRTGGAGIRLVSLHEEVVREVRQLLFLFLGAVAFLLLIACANVANLLLGRTAARQREVAIRCALGSGRGRLIRQFLTESILLALLGGLGGLLLAVWGLNLASAFIPPGSLPRLEEVSINLPVLIAAAAISMATGLIFGVVPAIQSSNSDVTTALKVTGTTHTPRSRLLSALVVSEVTLAFVLLTGAALLLESFWRLTTVDPGFQADSVLAASVTLPDTTYPTATTIQTFSTRVIERFRALPAVTRASAVNWLPLGGALIMGDFVVEDPPNRSSGPTVAKPAVSPEYFQTMSIPLRQGRYFTEVDTSQSPGVAIISEQLARQLWPGQSALGRRLKLGFGSPAQQQWLSIVGVVGDVKQNALGESTRPAIYVPLMQVPFGFLLRNLTFVVRSADAPAGLASAVRRELHAVDPLLPLDRVETMERLLSDSVSQPRFRAIVVGGFSVAALLLVAIGILGVLVFSVTRRTREIGLRMALGAERIDVMRLVMTDALTMAGIGIVAGTIASLALTRLITRFLFEVRPFEPTAFIAAAAVLAAVALIASYVPTRRATRVDPLTALRTE